MSNAIDRLQFGKAQDHDELVASILSISVTYCSCFLHTSLIELCAIFKSGEPVITIWFDPRVRMECMDKEMAAVQLDWQVSEWDSQLWITY